MYSQAEGISCLDHEVWPLCRIEFACVTPALGCLSKCLTKIHEDESSRVNASNATAMRSPSHNFGHTAWSECERYESATAQVVLTAARKVILMILMIMMRTA